MIILNTELAYTRHTNCQYFSIPKNKNSEHHDVEKVSSTGLMTYDTDTSNVLLTFRSTCEPCTDRLSWLLCKPGSGFCVKRQCGAVETASGT